MMYLAALKKMTTDDDMERRRLRPSGMKIIPNFAYKSMAYRILYTYNTGENGELLSHFRKTLQS